MTGRILHGKERADSINAYLRWYERAQQQEAWCDSRFCPYSHLEHASLGILR